MQPEVRVDAADMLVRLGRHWAWFMTFGTITFAAGVLALAWPRVTLLVVAVLFGVQLIVSGIFRFVAAFAYDELSGGIRVLLALLGVFSLIIGLYAVRHVLLTIVVLALLLGIFWVVNGTIELFAALSHREMANRGWTAFSGVLSVVAGVVLLAYPGLSVLTLAVLVGVWLLIYGLMEIVLAVRLRSAGRTGARVAHAM